RSFAGQPSSAAPTTTAARLAVVGDQRVDRIVDGRRDRRLTVGRPADRPAAAVEPNGRSADLDAGRRDHNEALTDDQLDPVVALQHHGAAGLDADHRAAGQLDGAGLVADALAGLDDHVAGVELAELGDERVVRELQIFDDFEPDHAVVAVLDPGQAITSDAVIDDPVDQGVVRARQVIARAILGPDHLLAAAEAALVQAPAHAQVHAPLGVDEDLLAAVLILDPQLVEAVAAERAGLDGRLARLARQRVGRGRVGVVDRSGDQRAVGVAVDERDHDLHADPRDDHRAVAVAGPHLRDRDPARGVLAVVAVPVPVLVAIAVEPDPHATERVGVDLVADPTDDDPGPHAVDPRPGRAP